MAVPKKRKSRMKKNIQKSCWKKKMYKKGKKALALAKSMLKKKRTTFVYIK